ncbi:MAG: nucleoside-diphosphate kinase [Candidatus Woesearchaeota archaeon]|nr:nucleoside-diphosphate kinase [Candidatus Aenigmarchaeota archaeon]MBU5689389.1 nucleoside-diphosphate kinase [Candidatus Aenigmarchaeota archaeon]
MNTIERTFVMIKPDAVQRGLIGEIIQRFERAGLKIIAMKMVLATKQQVEDFYPKDKEWFETVGTKTTKAYQEAGLDVKKTFGTTDLEKIGRIIKGWLIDFITSGPVVAMVIEGNHAITKVRNIVGYTDPLSASPGTIRGDLTSDSIALGNIMARAAVNLIHASSNPKDAEHEIKVWFKESELLKYKRCDEDIVLGNFLKK